MADGSRNITYLSSSNGSRGNTSSSVAIDVAATMVLHKDHTKLVKYVKQFQVDNDNVGWRKFESVPPIEWARSERGLHKGHYPLGYIHLRTC